MRQRKKQVNSKWGRRNDFPKAENFRMGTERKRWISYADAEEKQGNLNEVQPPQINYPRQKAN